MSKNAKRKLKVVLQAQQERDKVSAAKWHEHVQDLIKKIEGIGDGVLDDTVHDLKSSEASAINNEGARDGVLDDTVHDLKSSEASVINNEGAKAQVDYIIETLGPEQGVAEIEKVLS